MQQISKHVKAMSGSEYADLKREERKKQRRSGTRRNHANGSGINE